MLHRYYVDVSNLSDKELSDLKTQFDRFSFEVFEKYSDDMLYIIGFDIYLDEKYSFDELFKLPNGCKARRIG